MAANLDPTGRSAQEERIVDGVTYRESTSSPAPSAQSAGQPLSTKPNPISRTTAFAGPSYHASPEPSSLPIPSFTRPSVPAPSNVTSTEAMPYGARLMQKMGYKEGQGLGKECQGRTGIIEVTVRPPNLGLGAGTPVAKKQAWEVKKEEERLARLKAEQELKDSAERNEHVETLRMQVKAARAELYSKETQLRAAQVGFDKAKSDLCNLLKLLNSLQEKDISQEAVHQRGRDALVSRKSSPDEDIPVYNSSKIVTQRPFPVQDAGIAPKLIHPKLEEPGSETGIDSASPFPAMAGSSGPHNKPDFLNVGDNETSRFGNIRIENMKCLASYDWINKGNPTIAVPGTPKAWHSSGLLAQRTRKHSLNLKPLPFASLFAALQIMQPGQSLASVSLVTSRDCLQFLYTFAVGAKAQQDWWLEAELVGNTLFVGEGWRDDEGHSRQYLGFVPGLEGHVSHHRVVEYEIGGMKWIVHFEADGYDPEIEKADHRQAASKLITETSKVVEGVSVIQKGDSVSHASIVFLERTNSDHGLWWLDRRFRNPDTKILATRERIDITCQWFSQTPNNYVVYDDTRAVSKCTTYRIGLAGLFRNIESQDEPQLALKKLIVMIGRIRNRTGEEQNRKCCLMANVGEVPVSVMESESEGLQLAWETTERLWSHDEETGGASLG